jgi:uncharacterized protein YifN (PemK superfamily)
MSLKFHPDPGEILICSYSTGFIVPEMVKRRPVVVISPRLRRRDGLCTVVPMSTSQPDFEEKYHCRMKLCPQLPTPWDSEWMWVKGDMLATVCFSRLELVRGPKDFEGKRKNIRYKLRHSELEAVRTCVLVALGAKTG